MSDDGDWIGEEQMEYDDYGDSGEDGGGSPGSDSGYASPAEPDDDDYDSKIYLEEQPSSSERGKGKPYTIIDRESLRRIQEEALAQVQAILGCSTTTARALLIFFSWDAETVLGTIAERGQEEVYKRAGIISQAQDDAMQTCTTSSGQVTCMVCISEVRPSEVTAMDCSHPFCNDCWREHLRINISEGLSRRLKCMAPSCGVICDEGKVKALLRGNKALLEKYEQALLESYIDDNKLVKWCPSVPHCGHAIRVVSDPNVEVECSCSQKFCFNCCDEHHSPATCEMLADWMKRMKDGTETSSWLSANTKGCPKCSKPVEKNGGCNLVVCRCGQPFCWLCGQATGRAHTWTSIEGHACGGYKEEAESKASQAQRNLKRYLHYLTRYEAHLASRKLEEKHQAAIEVKIDEMIEREATVQNYSWLTEALQQLFLARKIMSFSYVAAYYLFGQTMFAADFSEQQNAINQALFEDKQGQLEMEVERLAKLVESPAEEILEQRMAIINLGVNIDMRITKMYEVIENEIAAQVASRSMNIAPYKGRRSAAGGEAAAEVYRQASAATAAAAAAAAAALGPSNSNLPSSDVIDLTAAESDDDEQQGRGRLGRATAEKGGSGIGTETVKVSGGKRARNR